jgi:hypothetical protein
MQAHQQQSHRFLAEENLIEQPTIRLLISPCRSGSTAFMHAMSHNPQVHAMYQPIKTGIREKGYPDYRVFDGSHKVFKDYPTKVIFLKETIGHANVSECCFDVFPNPETVIFSKPIYLFRDPVETWNSWKKLNFANSRGKSDLALFLKAYTHVYNTFITTQTISPHVSCLTREHLLGNLRIVFQRLCQKWDIPFSDSMINWEKSFDSNDNFTCTSSERKTFNRIMKDLKKTRSFSYIQNQVNFVTQKEREEIEKHLKPLYERVSEWSALYYPID